MPWRQPTKRPMLRAPERWISGIKRTGATTGLHPAVDTNSLKKKKLIFCQRVVNIVRGRT